MRITFLGGGSDHENFFKLHGGLAIYATINKYVFVCTMDQPNFVSDLYKFTYRKTEGVNSIQKIQHPVVREILGEFKWENPINIATMADLPESSGLGSSSAFTAALYQNLASRMGLKLNRHELSEHAINIERKRLKEPGGWQDQIATVYGGLRLIKFKVDGFNVSANLLNQELSAYLSPRMLLIRTKTLRKNMISAQANESLVVKGEFVNDIKHLVKESKIIWNKMKSSSSTKEIYNALSDSLVISWNYKSKWGSHVLNSEILMLIERLKDLGVHSYKLIGAGGGGCLLIMANPSIIANVKRNFRPDEIIQFKLVSEGTSTKSNL